MTTFDEKEVEKFSKIADEWWDEGGKFKPLHKFNPIRISFIRKKIAEHFKLNNNSKTPFSDLKIIDIGCGGGLISEPFAKMGAQMTAIDASHKNIEIAKIHSQKSDLKIDYKQSLVEDLDKSQKFNAVFALEIIEHVADVEKFVENCAGIVEKNGLFFVATLNRTVKSLLTAKFAAEYILRWLPIGTHDYKKFLKPSEINKIAEKNDLKLKEVSGFSYNILKDEWKQNPQDLDVNYIMIFEKK